MVATNVESEENLDRAKPLSKWKVYLVWLYSGLWGGHIFFLWNKHNNTLASVWKWFSFIMVLLVFIFNYTAIMYFYDTPSLFSFYMPTWSWSMPNSYFLNYSFEIARYLFFMNVLGGLIFIPYWTYVYNARYFRQHHENDKILSGKSVQADRFYHRLSAHIKSLTQELEDIKKYVKKDYIIEDPDKDHSTWGSVKRFLKNIATGGNSSKLEKEMDRLRLLGSCCDDLGGDIIETEMYNDELYEYLQKSRVAAYRNLYLSKELIGIIKTKISSEQQKLLVDEFKLIEVPDNMTAGVDFRASDIQFNGDNFLSSVGMDMDSTLQNLGNRLEKEGNLSKGDFIDKIKYFPNWSDDLLKADSEYPIPQLPDGFKIILAGNLGHSQNLDAVVQLILSLRDIKDLKWIFIGNGSEKEWLDHFIEANKLSDTAFTLGRFPLEAMPGFFKKADALLVTLRSGFPHLGMVVPARLQAYMSAGRPVLAMIGNGGADVIKEANCGYAVPAGDYEALATIIRNNVLVNKEAFETLGHNGRCYFEREFQKDICIDNLCRILKEDF